MKAVGLVIFILGFLSAIVAAASPRPLSFAFFFSLVIALAGVVMIRVRGHIQGIREPEEKKGQADPADSGLMELQALKEKSRALVDEMQREDFDFAAAKAGIEDIMKGGAVFIEKKDWIVALCGISAAAGLLTAYAAGERNTNRAWSALVDGCREEAVSSLRNAAEGFDNAAEIFGELVKQHR